MNVFILTRFNIRLWWTEDKEGTPVQTEEWLEERFRLFEKYTYPSVRAQYYGDFRWICLFDADTPERYKKNVDQYIHDEPRLDACFLTANEASKFQQFFQRRVAELADDSDEELLTIYLDSDDCIRTDFISRLVGHAANCDYGTVFSFKYGLQYYEQMNIAVKIPYPNNHFLAYYERMGEHVRTVWAFWHFSIYKYKKIRIYTDENRDNPMWIEVIHQSNVDNDVKMTLSQVPVFQKDYLKNYGLPLIMEGTWKTIAMFVSRFSVRFVKQVVRRAKNKLLKHK